MAKEKVNKKIAKKKAKAKTKKTSLLDRINASHKRLNILEEYLFPGKKTCVIEKDNFKLGTVVVFEPKNFNPDFWNNLSEKDRIKYYKSLGYGSDKKKFFVFLTEIKNSPGHCILVSLDDGRIEVMRHISDFREVTEDEL